MTPLLQVSDPHFGTEQPPVVEALLRLVREQTLDLMVLSGDITRRARRHQFRTAKGFVYGFAIPTVALPGNHDIPLFNFIARIFYPYANHQRVFGSNLKPEVESNDMLVITVNTTRPARLKNGEVSLQQVEKGIAARLRSARPNQLPIVVTHQPGGPISCLTVTSISLRANGTRKAMATFSSENPRAAIIPPTSIETRPRTYASTSSLISSFSRPSLVSSRVTISSPKRPISEGKLSPPS